VKKFVVRCLFVCLATVLSPLALAEIAVSETYNDIFNKYHFKNVKQPGKLRYVFHKESSLEGERDDVVELNVSNFRNTGRCDQAFKFFTEQYNRPYEAMTNKRGNAVHVLFLQYDVNEMERLTGGHKNYFQTLIRTAFTHGVPKKEVEFDYQGKQVKGYQYVIQPYAKDPKNSRYILYSSKYYILTFSDEIPGELYQVRTVVPDGKTWQEGEPVLSEETLTFAGYVVE
jgi:hypothetical protein